MSRRALHRRVLFWSTALAMAGVACGTPDGTGRGRGSAGEAATGGVQTSGSTGAATGDDSLDTSAGGEGETGDDTGANGYACVEPPACDPSPGTGPTKVEMRVHGIDDVVLAEVNGLRRGFWSTSTLPGRDSGRLDITGWFSRGDNELRILVANTGGPANVGLQVWVDGALVVDSTCSAEVCPPGVEIPLGFFFEESIAISSEAFACPQQVCVHGEEEGSLYVDGVYVGARAPTELLLPPGTYEIGVGSGTDDPPPDAGPTFEHEGRFRQRTVSLVDAEVDVELGAADLVEASTYDFLVVPIRNVQYTNGQTGVLADDVPAGLAEGIEQASENLASPFSYGLAQFTATVHPVLETTVVANEDGYVPIDMAALTAAGLDPAAVDSHDIIVWAYSSHLVDGTPVSQPPCCAWGGGNEVWMHTGWVYEVPIMHYVFVHEWLHTAEDELARLGYGGEDGVHGADEHGYMSGSNGEFDFGQFYRLFMRGQLAERGTWVGAVMSLWQQPMTAAPTKRTLHRIVAR